MQPTIYAKSGITRAWMQMQKNEKVHDVVLVRAEKQADIQVTHREANGLDRNKSIKENPGYKNTKEQGLVTLVPECR